MFCIYRLAYQELVGGVLNMRTEHFQRVNGYSNLYWGWGAEDDDMAYRWVNINISQLLIQSKPLGGGGTPILEHGWELPLY